MVHKVTQLTRTLEGRLRHNTESSKFQKKPSQPAHERSELCSSFLADRGCLTTHLPHGSRNNSAA